MESAGRSSRTGTFGREGQRHFGMLRGAVRRSVWAIAGLCVAAALVPGNCGAQQPSGGEAERPGELAAIDAYVGVWDAEQRTSPDGRSFRFVYSLEWFDRDRTIVEMVITQVFEDGETRLLWSGFKGWDRPNDVVYYHGFSPGGRAAEGFVEAEGDALVTSYRGWGAASESTVEIRDVFSAVQGGTFTSITYMKRAGDWAEVSRDHWTRRTSS